MCYLETPKFVKHLVCNVTANQDATRF